MGITDSKVAERVAAGVYALRGWGIAISFAIETPNGWITVDTGDSARAAAEMRAALERAVGKKIKVAAILLTHFHYADGTDAWLDQGTEVWGARALPVVDEFCVKLFTVNTANRARYRCRQR